VKGVGKRRHRKEQLRIDAAWKWAGKALELADDGEEGAVAALLALMMGMRASEIVSRVVRDLDDNGRLLVIPDAKTPAGVRTLEVPELLRPYLLEQAEGRKPEELLFGYHYRDWVRRICTAAKVPVVTAHGMRGLHSTIAVQRGMTGHVVAGALGHESETTTFQSYVDPEAAARARQRVLVDSLTPGAN
jgi:integrase